MSKSKILFQLDPDKHASAFDAVVAIDAGVDHLVPYAKVEPQDVRSLVYGAIFTRGVDDLHRSAIFVGGTQVSAGEALLKAVTDTFFGPLRVSVMLDANGANTTAAAAVVAVERHLELSDITALVLGGTGPVGQRVARLLAQAGGQVRLGSRDLSRARSVCDQIRHVVPAADLNAVAPASDSELSAALDGVQLVVAAGAAGVCLLPASVRRSAPTLQVAIDLNAVPPLGIEGIEVSDSGFERGDQICYGAIGVGGTKMKIHKAAVAKLFENASAVLDAEEIFQLGRKLSTS